MKQSDAEEAADFMLDRIEDIVELLVMRYKLEPGEAANNLFINVILYATYTLESEPIEEPLKSQVEIFREIEADMEEPEPERKPSAENVLRAFVCDHGKPRYGPNACLKCPAPPPRSKQ